MTEGINSKAQLDANNNALAKLVIEQVDRDKNIQHQVVHGWVIGGG